MLTIPVTILSLVYMALLTVAYFSKGRIPSIENKVYSNMIKISLLGIIIDATSALLVVYQMTDTLIFRVVTILIFMYYILWSCLFVVYTYIISFKKKNMTEKDFKNKHGKKIKIIFAVFIVSALLIPLMPLNYHEEGNVVFPMGLSVDFTYFIAGFLSFGAMIVMMLINRKNIKSKKYVPVYSLIILFIIVVIIQKFNPGLILTTAVECFITFLMYFTIENPDVQMIEELYKNKKLIEKSNEDTSNFLFRMTQDIKNPVKDLLVISNNLAHEKDPEKIKDYAKTINNYSMQLDYLINDALDVSTMNTKNLKIYTTRYNVLNLFKEAEYRVENQLKEDVKFDFSISNNIPEYLYGDSIKIKQILFSILNNSINNTEKGFITMDVSSIIKYGICRLIITINDSGKGMDITAVNDILSLNNSNMESINLNDENDKILNLKATKKLIGILGGSMILKSEVGIGTTVTIILEQKIVNTKETELSKKLDSYEQTLYKDKQVMVVDDDAKELAQITNFLEKHEAIVSGSLFGRDCIEKIKAKMKYDLIILDDETSTYSAYDVLKELKKDKKFNIPVVIMLDDKKEFIKLHYLQDGFADCIMKSKLESELERILKRF